MKRAIIEMEAVARNMKLRTETRRALFSTLFLFGLLTWLYVIIFQMIYPDVMSATLTHINIFPLNLRVDVTGIVAFVVSAVAFFFLQLTPKREGGREIDH
jgi:hypothetical protein